MDPRLCGDDAEAPMPFDVRLRRDEGGTSILVQWKRARGIRSAWGIKSARVMKFTSDMKSESDMK